MGTRRSLVPSTLVLPAVLLLLFYGAGNAYCSVLSDNTMDRLSLLDFKKAITKDPTGALHSWNDSIHHCMWRGVDCSKSHPGRVTELYLCNMSLDGHITPSLGNLTFLEHLNLGANRFSGKFPPLNRLITLEGLYLYDNLLQWSILDALVALANCSKLQILDMSYNMLVGSIPPNIGALSYLLRMELTLNNLTGHIPPTFSNITHLEEISLGDNHLKGSIPEELGQLPNMSWLELGENRLSGRVPATLFNLSNLQYLDFSINMLSGTLQSGVGNMLPNLQCFLLDSNKFQGHVTDSLCNASELITLNLSSSYLTGNIPGCWGKLHNLQYLNLEKNKFQAQDSQSWEFLSALSNCPDLQTLSLYGNQLQGVLPHSVDNLSIMLQELNLGANNLFGILPRSIGALKNLEDLDLGGNNFVGPIPHSISNLSKLWRLNLSSNHFDGWLCSAWALFDG